MEFWFIIPIFLCLCLLVMKAFPTLHIPPGPFHLPIITDILWLKTSFSELLLILRSLHAKYGPMITIHFLSTPHISITDRSLAYEALIHKGAIFANRPKILSNKIATNNNQLNITSSFYGPTWRVLRRNLTSVMLHPSQIRSFSSIRKWVLDDLIIQLKSDAKSSHSIKVINHIHHAMFCLLLFMCFGEKIDHKKIKDIKHVQRRLISSFSRFSALNFFPTMISRILFPKRWQELLGLQKAQEDILAQLIRARKRATKTKEDNDPNECVFCYVDTLLNLELLEEKRKLDDSEIVSLCSEFLTSGTDTTSTLIEWVMANLVKYTHVQQRLVEEIGRVLDDREEKEVKEEDLQNLPYLKAVILEGLRLHPPSYFVVPHAVTEDVVLNGYLIPKNATVTFMVAEMGLDPMVWEDPMVFKPERFFIGENEFEAFDITRNKEIKMMPFGAGRRICPAYNLAMLHLEYFVANLVWNFEWKTSLESKVDLSSTKQNFTVMMKHPLQSQISPRIYSHL